MSELSDKAIQEIQNAVKTEIITDKAGNEYSTRAIFPVKEKILPAPQNLKVSTLTGIVDFCSINKSEEPNPDPQDIAFIHIVSHSEVLVYSGVFGPSKQRTNFMTAEFESLLGHSFQFGQFYDHESFIVGLQSLFEPTPQRADVLKVIGTIKESQVREFSDDGVSQAVAAKAGVALVSDVQVPNPVALRPFRTFREIEQPESLFILRVRQGRDGQKPTIALIEADGGRWKLEAILKIKEYLEDKLEMPIIA